MNKTLKDEELDRELVLKSRATGSIYDAVKVKVGIKNLTFESYHHEMPPPAGGSPTTPWIHKTRVIFKKECGAQRDCIEIETHNFTKRRRFKKCNLGHHHDSEEYEWNDWQRMMITWEDFEQLIEWFQTGRFYDPRSRQAKQRGSKTGFHSEAKI